MVTVQNHISCYIFCFYVDFFFILFYCISLSFYERFRLIFGTNLDPLEHKTQYLTLKESQTPLDPYHFYGGYLAPLGFS